MDNPASESYTPTELLICTAARLMTDYTTAFISTGIPMLAASLAQRMHAPNLVTVFEFGGTGAILETLPMAVGGECTFHRAIAATGISDVMETAQRGFIEYGFIGGAQIDSYGNLNSTVIGEYYHPKVRLPGSGGGNDVGSFCWRTIAIMRQDKRRFLEKIDFITTPGYLTGPVPVDRPRIEREVVVRQRIREVRGIDATVPAARSCDRRQAPDQQTHRGHRCDPSCPNAVLLRHREAASSPLNPS